MFEVDRSYRYLRTICENTSSNAVRFLDEVLEGLGLDRALFMANSPGSLWVSWMALEGPGIEAERVNVGCPEMVLDTSAPFPMRLLSVRPMGWLFTWLQPPESRQVERLNEVVRE